MPALNRHVEGVLTALGALLALIVIGIRVQHLHGEGWAVFLSITGWLNIGILLFYATILVLLIARPAARASSVRPLHWVFAFSGTFLPFLLLIDTTPDPRLALLAAPIQLLAMVLMVAALSTLGRGFGIIAARRVVRTTGLYSVVRHPLYAAEAVFLLSIVIGNLSVYNVFVLVLQIGCQIRRMAEEEKLLSGDPAYPAYRQRVRFRMVPGVY